jgi:hypothetical protein
MRPRGLFVALILLAALAGGLYYSNKQKAAEAAKPPADTPPKIVALTEGDITKVVLKKGAYETDLQKTGGKWQITAPMPYAADQSAVSQLVTSAANVSSDRVVEDKASNLAPYGLNSPILEIDISGKGGKISKLKIGDDTPTNSGSYAMLEGDPRVFTVASYVKTGLDKSVNDLRDQRLLTFDQDKLSRVELVAKKEDIEFGRDKDQWQIVKPKPLRADGLQVDEMLRKLKDAKMDLTLSPDDAKKAAAAFASGTPVATVKLTDPSGTQQIDIRKVTGALNKNADYYAKSSVVPGVFKATPDLATGVDKSVDDFRNKKLFDFGFNDPNKVEMHVNGKTYSFQKGGDDWFANGKKQDSVSLQSLLDKLRDLTATKFIDTGTLGAPSIDLTVVSSNGKLTEKVFIAKQGADYIAQRENEPALYSLDAKTVDDLSHAASDVKAAPPAKK